ncbi:MAG: ABC transporter permease [Chitinophagales bacterium]|nr:ABC transporter permease [Chitinophagales bacterium]MDW8274712.1 ABC transporter permease [Chitinophagales bacterium]
MNFFRILLYRLFSGLLVLAGVIVIVFFLFNILPVNSARMTLGQRADAASLAAIEKEFRLNKPWHIRLLLYFNDVSPLSLHDFKNEQSPIFVNRSDISGITILESGKLNLVIKLPYLGKSFQSRRKVSDILGEKILPTVVLALSAMIIASIIGILLGVIAAIRQHSAIDNAVLIFSTLGISQPAYFSGILLAMLFGYYLSDYTGLNVRGSFIELNLLGDTVYEWKNLVLPALALGIRPVSIIAQLTRSSMIEAMQNDFVRTARAKGLPENTVIFKHALRNALNPVVTSISGWLAALLTGAFFIEKVFDYKGLGLQTIESLMLFDFPVVMGAVLFVAFIFVTVNFITDMLYALLDPRVSIKS